MFGERTFAVLVLALACVSVPASDLRLIMFDSEGCEFCELWEREVGVVYAKTDEGRRAPLARHPLHEPEPVVLERPVRYTPTFVLARDGRESGRITGYPGEDHFWGLLGMLLADRAPAATRQQAR